MYFIYMILYADTMGKLSRLMGMVSSKFLGFMGISFHSQKQ